MRERYDRSNLLIDRGLLCRSFLTPRNDNQDLNDFKFDNVVLDPKDPLKIIGVLDWEMTTIGDPLMDLGGSLGYWVEAGDPEKLQRIRMLPTNHKGAMTRKQVADFYAQISGRSIEAYDFYYCFGLFKLSVIAQQGGKAATLDFDSDRGEKVAAELGNAVIFCKTNFKQGVEYGIN